MAKMTLFIYLPILFSSPSEHFSDEVKTKLLVAAIEVAEYNHTLNTEQACRQWRWIYQTYTHWHAVVYLLIEISRRPWSPIIERAWAALHSQWLIPAQSHMDKNLRIWVPLRKLTARARKHREAELERLRGDPQAAERLEIEDQKLPAPGSSGPFPAGSNVVEIFREQWRQLLVLPEGPGHDTRSLAPRVTSPSAYPTYTNQPSTSSIPAYNTGGLGSNTYLDTSGFQTNQNLPSPDVHSAIATNVSDDFAIEQNAEPSYNTIPALPTNWSMSAGIVPFLWADADPSIDVFANVDVDALDANMDLEGMDWYNWVESAKGMELDAGPSGNGPT